MAVHENATGLEGITLEHWSKSPLVTVFSRAQREEPERKPRGLWVSVKGPDDWQAWCGSEDFRLDHFSICHQIETAENANILVVDTLAKIEAFHSAYSRWARDAWRSDYIHWAGVAEDYDGIIIAPYRWECRLELPISRWYYSWDCASGCIWNAEAVGSVREYLQQEPTQ